MPTQTTVTPATTAPAATPTPHNLVASDRVEGTAVYRADGKRQGTIVRLMIDKASGNVAYAVLRFGGFLRMGEKHLPVPWARMKFDKSREGYVLDMTDDEIADALSHAAAEDFDWGDRSREYEIHNYYMRAGWGAY